MKKQRTIAGALLLAVLAGSAACGGGPAPAPPAGHQPQLVGLHGASTAGVTAMASGATTTISFASAAAPRYLRLELADGQHPLSWHWSGSTAAAMLLATPDNGNLAVALVPLPGQTPGAVALTVTGGSSPLSDPPADTLAPAGFAAAGSVSGNVTLSWTEALPGDCNFDGQVDLTDLAALAALSGQHVDRSAPQASQSAAYWADTDASGTVDTGDSAAIGRNLGLAIGGYRVFHDLAEAGGPGPGGALVGRSSALAHAGLPCTYSVQAAGAAADSWRVVPVDAAGTALGGGAATGGATLQVQADISGVAVVPTTSGDKLDSRVIDPIESIDKAVPVTTVVAGSSVTVTNVPRAKVFVINLTYTPAVSLAASGTRGAAAAGAPVTTALAFDIPAGGQELAIDADIAFAPNPAGGYFITLHTRTAADGGPGVESDARLDYAGGGLRRDTNSNGSFDDEFAFGDGDRDCISDPMLDQLRHAPPAGSAPGGLRISGRVQTLDLQTGLLALTEVQSLDGAGGLPAALTIRIAENMRLGPAPGQPLPRPGDMVEAMVYLVSQSDSATAYWADSLHPLFGGPGPGPQAVVANPQPDGSMQVSWQGNASYTGYRIVRYSSPFSPDGPGGHFNPCQPNLLRDWSLDVPPLPLGYHDVATEPGHVYSYDVYGLSGTAAVYLGSGGFHPPPPPGQQGGPPPQ